MHFPYKISHVDSKLNPQLLKDFRGQESGYVQVGPKKWFFPARYAEDAEDIYNFQIRSDDIFVISAQRSGTTMTQEMVWLLSNNLDYEKAAESPVNRRFPYLESNLIVDSLFKNASPSKIQSNPLMYKHLEELVVSRPFRENIKGYTEPRFIKTHLPFSLLPPGLTESGCKVIYLARNPKDLVVSLYHLSKSLVVLDYRGDFKQFWNYYKHNLVLFTPYWEHVKEGWERRREDNVLFIFYEEMIKDLRKTIDNVSAFLSKSYSDQELEKLVDHMKIENFRKNKSVNFQASAEIVWKKDAKLNFIRNGKSGEWKENFDEEMKAEADEWMKENLQGTDLRFPE